MIGAQHLSRDLRAALAATRGKNGATSARLHTLAETVDLGTTTVVRLESPLRHGVPPKIKTYGSAQQKLHPYLQCMGGAQTFDFKTLVVETPRGQ